MKGPGNLILVLAKLAFSWFSMQESLVVLNKLNQLRMHYLIFLLLQSCGVLNFQ